MTAISAAVLRAHIPHAPSRFVCDRAPVGPSPQGIHGCPNEPFGDTPKGVEEKEGPTGGEPRVRRKVSWGYVRAQDRR